MYCSYLSSAPPFLPPAAALELVLVAPAEAVVDDILNYVPSQT